MMRLRYVLPAAAVLLAASALAGVAQPQLGRSAGTPARTITVSGEGTVTTVPDRASFSFTVDTRAATAAAALARNADAAAAVVDAAVGAGADEVSGPSLYRSDADSLYREALKDAVANAHDKADAIAAAAGLTLGGVQT